MLKIALVDHKMAVWGSAVPNNFLKLELEESTVELG